MPRLEFTVSSRRAAFCEIEVPGLVDGRTAIIATELSENPGMSITNAAEEAATAVCRQLGIDPHRLVWIEHYDANSYRDRGTEESFDVVTFRKVTPMASVIFAAPAWKRMKAEDWATLDLPPRCPLVPPR